MKAAHAYVHVPFCARRCVYCDFSIAVRPSVPVDEYVTALATEWNRRHPERSHLDSLYLGGGTPSKVGGDGVARILDVARGRAEVTAATEVTLEANPEDVGPAAVRMWLDAGVNRVSLGVQSFDNAVLAWMHRTHDAAAALRAVHVLRESGLHNISIDLMFATPAEVSRDWSAEIDAAVQLGLPHLSIYGLTVEPHTPLGRRVARRDVAEAPEETFEQQFLTADRALTASGYDHYEVSNYGKPAFHSAHNWAYWHRRPYLGLGPSAHEFDGTSRRWNVEAYARWLAAVAVGDPVAGSETLDREQRVAEQVYLGLRTSEGLHLTPGERSHVASWIRQEWAQLDGDRMRLTAAGWLRLDAIAADLTLLRSRY